MKCLKIILGIVCVSFTFILSHEIVVNNTYAVSTSGSGSIPTSAASAFYFCDNSLQNSSTLCSDYYDSSSYIYLTLFDFSTQSGSGYLQLRSCYLTSSNCYTNNRYNFINSGFLLLSFKDLYSLSIFTNGVSSDYSYSMSSDNPTSSGITPTGSLSITENGTYDVTNYAEAVVDVPQSSGGGSGGDYSDELNGVITAIYTCGAILLVIYFFYCIYRMIIKSTGGK